MGVGKHKGNFTYLYFWLELTRILSTSIMSYKIGITEKQYVKALKWPNNQTDLFQYQSRNDEHLDDYFDFFSCDLHILSSKISLELQFSLDLLRIPFLG